MTTPVAPRARGWVWVDFENTPHVLFLEPIIQRLRALGLVVRISAKPQSQTLALARARGIDVEPVGNGDLEGRTEKILGGLSRAAQLARWAGRRKPPAILVCSSRTAALAALMLRVPVVGLLDYEHAEHRPLALASRSLWLPDILGSVRLPWTVRRVARFYAGLKENLYLDSMTIDPLAERITLGLGATTRLVVTRPPATNAHYAVRNNYFVWRAAVLGVVGLPGVEMVIIPRNAGQVDQVEKDLGSLKSARILTSVVSGPRLIAGADLVLGGGGTMNREAAVLGVPVWSVFTGPIPAIDAQLAREGRLRWVRSEAELSAALRDGLPQRQSGRGPFPEGLATIMAEIERVSTSPSSARD